MSNLQKEFYELCKKHQIIGANFVITSDTKLLESHSYGYRDLERELTVNNKTIYRVASISKAIGAIGLMKLYEKGKIDINEDISKYLGFLVRNPKYPDVIITAKMLMLHTSSILDGYGDISPANDGKQKGYCGVNGTNIIASLEDLLSNINSPYYTPCTFSDNKPGTWWRYSNFGAGIVACLIEKVSGEYYVDYMTKHIFTPLGLDASYRASLIDDQNNISTMYSKNNENKDLKSPWKIYPKENFINSYYNIFPLGDNYRGPAGGLFISMEDLSIIVRMLLNYGTYNGIEILKRETVEYMYQVQWAGSPVEFFLTKGMQMEVINKLALRGHTGGAYGLRDYMFFSLKYKIGVCFVFNGFDVDNEKEACDEIFSKTQDLVINAYVTEKEDTIIINKNEIILNERKIIDQNLFCNNYIKAIAFCDMLDIVGKFDQTKNNIEITFDKTSILIEDTIQHLNYLYIDFEKTLALFTIKYEKKNNSYIIKKN